MAVDGVLGLRSLPTRHAITYSLVRFFGDPIVAPNFASRDTTLKSMMWSNDKNERWRDRDAISNRARLRFHRHNPSLLECLLNPITLHKPARPIPG
jgi:hypothetical protein